MTLVVSDLDGTLTTGSSWRGLRCYFQKHYSAWTYNLFFLRWLPRFPLMKLGLLDKQKTMTAWMQAEIGLLRGEPSQALNEMAEVIVVEELWPERRVDMLAKLDKHRQSGAQIAIVSSAYQPIVEAFARRIGGVRAIGSRLMYEGDRLAGVALPINSFERKVENIRSFYKDSPIIAAYGDTISDIPMLEMSRNPIAVYPDDGLRRVAEARGWRMMGRQITLCS
ncbi:MAG: HAD-IB family phosphatase [Chloroflexota bacterium]|nr:HAD-IB family phosphatase [Chloroflexota bacterium]